MVSGQKKVWSKVASVMLAAGMVWALAGCATNKRLDEVEAKADRALQMAQDSKASAERADNAAMRAEKAADRAEAMGAKMEGGFMHKMQK